ncbi:hypothetical protein ACUQ99_37360, partial [Azospirillum sp. A39]
MMPGAPVIPPPGYGRPCNRCGCCCLDGPCHVAFEVLGVARGACPALEQDGGTYRCGLYTSPGRYGSGPEWTPERIS